MKKAVVNAILYFPPKLNEPAAEIDSKSETIIEPELIVPSPKAEEKKAEVKEAIDVVESNVLEAITTAEPNIKNTAKSIFNPAAALQSLKQDIDREHMQLGQEQAYQDFVARKNYIPPSSTKLDEIPEAKPVQVNVSCDNAFSKGLTILSNIMGGSVKCQRFNGAQKFIDARLEKLGKQEPKNKQKKTDD